jgi:altronate dehydratase
VAAENAREKVRRMEQYAVRVAKKEKEAEERRLRVMAAKRAAMIAAAVAVAVRAAASKTEAEQRTAAAAAATDAAEAAAAADAAEAAEAAEAPPAAMTREAQLFADSMAAGRAEAVAARAAAVAAAREEWAYADPKRREALNYQFGERAAERDAAVNEALAADIQSKIIDVANGNSTFRDLYEIQKLIAFQPSGGTRKYRRKPRRKLKSRRK